WKAWYTYGKVYQLLGTDSITKSADPTFLFHAFEGYTKIFELANGRIDKFTMEDIVNNLKNLSVAFYNNGIDSYNTKDFESSSNFFIGVTEIDEVLVQESGE
ncbi:MAG TPA: hypothetical protein DEO99_00205, partial [Bacteroidetes bacterium]|nr:hypothetical protein [Bacteroidota bacterium]